MLSVVNMSPGLGVPGGIWNVASQSACPSTMTMPLPSLISYMNSGTGTGSIPKGGSPHSYNGSISV
jgi:hypothetical protein